MEGSRVLTPMPKSSAMLFFESLQCFRSHVRPPRLSVQILFEIRDYFDIYPEELPVRRLDEWFCFTDPEP